MPQIKPHIIAVTIAAMLFAGGQAEAQKFNERKRMLEIEQEFYRSIMKDIQEMKASMEVQSNTIAEISLRQQSMEKLLANQVVIMQRQEALLQRLVDLENQLQQQQQNR